jgi:hypothetical protein
MNSIANELMLSYDNVKSKYTYVDITDKDNKISYMHYTDVNNIDEYECYKNHEYVFGDISYLLLFIVLMRGEEN